MPLFPAYTNPLEKQESSQSNAPLLAIEANPDTQVTSWLTNASFSASSATAETHVPSVKSEEKVEYITEFVAGPSKSETSEEEDRNVKQDRKEKHKHHKKEKKLRRRSSSSEDRHRSKSKKKKKKKDKKKEAEEALNFPRLPKNVVFIDNTGLKPSEAFRIDREGDRQNLAFPNMHYAFIPKYFVLKKPLGRDATASRKGLVKRKKPPRYYSKRTIKMMKNSDLSPIIVDVKKGPGALHSFAPMNPVKPRNEAAEQALQAASNPLGIYDPGTLHYLQGKGLETDTSAVSQNPEVNQLRQMNKEFNEQLRFKPNDIQFWLKFVDFQEKRAGIQSYEEDATTQASEKDDEVKKRKVSPKALLERKVAILDRALHSNPRSLELLMAKMRIGAEYWDGATLQKQWRQVLFLYPTDVQIWKLHISMTAANFSEFSVTAITKLYANALQKLVQAQSPTFASRDKPQHLEEEIVDIFTDLCTFLHKAGHSEKAIALYQALLELNFHRLVPDAKKVVIHDLLRKMELFWDLGAPRFGEEGALGWVNVLQTQKPGVRILLSSGDVEDELVNSCLPRQQLWLEMERLRQRYHLLPWTANPEVEDEVEDKERLVDWDDLSCFLFLVDQDNESLRFRMLQGFLYSLKVSVPKLQSVRWHSPCQASASSLEDTNLFTLSDSSAPQVASCQKLQTDWCRDEVYCGLVRNIFSQGFQVLKTPEIQASLIAWWMSWEKERLLALASEDERITSWKEVKKRVKNIIKDYGTPQNNVLLYTFYAKMEWVVGNEDECLRILQMVMTTLPGKLLEASQSDAPLHALHLWNTFVEYCLLKWNKGEEKYWKLAQSALVQLGCGEKYQDKYQISAPALLKAKRSFEAVLEHASWDQIVPLDLVNLVDSVTDAVFCSIWFLFITENWDASLQEAQKLMRREAKKCSRMGQKNRFDLKIVSCHFRRELLLTGLLKLQSLAPKRQSIARETLLSQGLEDYVGNLEFLARFIESEESCRIVDKLWCRITAKALQGNELSPWTVAACCLALLRRDRLLHEAEFRSWEQEKIGPFVHSNGLRYKMRSFLENCLENPENSHCPLLWRLYLYLWYITGDTKKVRANFYRAIRDCPSAKALYMDAVEYVPSMLKEVCDLLTDKELRLHFLLEELDVLLEPEEGQELEPIPDWDNKKTMEESDDASSEVSSSGDEEADTESDGGQ